MLPSFLNKTETISDRLLNMSGEILSKALPKQEAFILDPERRVSARCPRRAGKTTACIILIMYTMLREPGAQVLYLCLTRGQAEKNIWTALRNLDAEYAVEGTFVGGGSSELKYSLPNGSSLWLRGGETQRELEKNRGQWFSLIIIDEGKSFSPVVLEEAIDEILWPTLGDKLGKLVFIGTPGNILAGPFYEATCEDRPDNGWSRHSWDIADNTALPHLWEEALDTQARKGWADDHPTWVREYLGKWCPSSDVMVFHAFDAHRNLYSGELPSGHKWTTLLGVYLGFGDDWGVCIANYSDTCPGFYVTHCRAYAQATMDQVAKRLKELLITYPADVLVLNKDRYKSKLIEAFSSNHDIPLIQAEAIERFDVIDLINADLATGDMVIPNKSDLITEWAGLQWENDKRKLYAEGCQYQCTEAFLFLWNHAYHHHARPHEKQLEPGTHAYIRAELDRQEHEAAHPDENEFNYDIEQFDVGFGFEL